jgi:hypothetical protein
MKEKHVEMIYIKEIKRIKSRSYTDQLDNYK